MTTASPLLAVRDLDVRYGTAQSLRGLSFDVFPNSTLAVLGPNGAGKSTLARALSGLVRPAGGQVRLDGRDITGKAPEHIRRAGLVHLPEGRGVFPTLTVTENLRMATACGRRQRAAAIERALEVFPVLAARQRQTAGTLSGGEQQMLSLARALTADPRLVVADELSLGLAPKMVDVVFESLRRARSAGVAVIMIEQFVGRALAFADHCLVLQRGRIAWAGEADRAEGELSRRYLGEATTA
ncbi:ABC transporter ATP-binding protein [Streptomyces sp. NPDC005774]|uniref:ABC transporter ATP-binding protein n=1 Tax=Streptomyces sp. NPDC005774 TaxID=3364728 RepID=UPI0036BBCADF